MNKVAITAVFLFAAVLAAEIDVNFGVEKVTFYANGTLSVACDGTLSGIDSILTDSTGAAVGVYNGTFYHNDGSFTRSIGTIQSTPNAGTISNVLASALRRAGSNTFDRIQFFTRYNATGGVLADPTACPGRTPFNATYSFYRAGPFSTAAYPVTLKASARAIGTLNVVCGATAGTSTVSGIVSTLFNLNSDTVFGSYNGSFFSADGSSTRTNGTIQSAAATANTSLDYFLANAVNTAGAGNLNGVSYITRYDTVGGVSPCTGSNTGSTTNVPFEASYGFYALNPTSTSSSGTTTVSGSGTGTGSTNSALALTVSSALVFASALLFA